MKNVIVLFLVLISMVLIVVMVSPTDRVVMYDCRISEISPDIPPEVKEACRRHNYEQLQNERKTQYNI